MLIVGYIKEDKWSKRFSEDINSDIRRKTEQETQVVYFDTEKDLINALVRGKISVAPRPLWLLPVVLPQGIVITSLSERQQPSYSLIFTGITREDGFPSMGQEDIIGFTDDICRQQFFMIFDTWRTQTDSIGTEKAIDNVKNGQWRGAIIRTIEADIHQIANEAFHLIRFSPKELIPEAGLGVTAFLTAEDDFKTRRIIRYMDKNEHSSPYKPVSYVTNVERRFKQLCENKPVAVYCERDRTSNYHLLVAVLTPEGSLIKSRLSQSTYFELAENCYKSLAPVLK